MPDKRVTLRRRLSYNTSSNRVRRVKTPGGRVVVQYIDKTTKGVRAPASLGGARLQGLRRAAPKAYARLSRKDRTVSRAYGGVLSHSHVRERILRAFLTEEQRMVKKVLEKKQKK
eukprot:TRINITY_DN2664_c0_g1_i2.p1 TRINITY_DN2664_c0_g1~~TRINITY_DN2664_c0_g1_i2.p1  ORF type:complete len:115 (+),score=26.95 TRINITY_DN2664_c0_g1_i2:95-439(+)